MSDDVYTMDVHHIPSVLARTICPNHNALVNEPCFRTPNLSGRHGYYSGVCNSRAKRAGFYGSVMPSSLRQGRNG